MSSRWNRRKPSSRGLKPTWADQRPVELRAPARRVRVRVRTHDVAFPKVWTRRVPLSHDPGIERAPGGGEAFIGPVKDRPGHGRGRQLARLDPTHGGDSRRDRHADLKVKNLRVHPQVVREPWASRSNALGGHRGPELADARPHDV